MKNIVLALVATAAVAANAQTAAPAATTTAAPAGSVSVAAPTAAPAKKWKATVFQELAAGVAKAEANKGSAPASGPGYVGLTYKTTDTVTLGARLNHTMNLNADREDKDARAQQMVMGHTTLTASVSTKATLLGSEAISPGFRLEIGGGGQPGNPIRKADIAAVLRNDTSLDWTINPKLSAGVLLSPRINIYQEDAADRDGVMRLVLLPSITYSFSDAVNAYSSITFDERSTELARGTARRMEAASGLDYEVGMNISMKAAGVSFSLNPALTSSVAGLGESANPISENSRIFAAETNSYYLGASASF
jgi:hypothetical protein